MKTKIALISLFNIDFGIRYISSYLNSKGYSTYVISFGVLKLKEEIFCNNYITPSLLQQNPCPDKDVQLLIALLLNLKPDLIGISVPSTSFITASILTQKIREKFDMPIVWGGIHPTLCPEDCISHADIVCVGEGEYPMLELVEKLENKEDLTNINNLWIRKEDNSIEKNDLRNLIQDLDSLPYPDFVNYGNKFLIDEGKVISSPIIISVYKKNEYPIMSSRGCPFGCSYCCNSVLRTIYGGKGPYLRRRTPENVIDELVYVRNNREVSQIRFWDDVFTYDQEWIGRFHKLYIKEISVPFTCYAQPRYTDKKIIQMLAEAGLVSADLGIQSGSESFCKDRFRREQSNEEIIEFANLLNKLGVVPRYNVIVDNPYESDTDANATAELLMELPRPYIAALYSLCYFAKTELTLQALKDKLITEEEIEGRDNKALNNWYMFIDLAKDKKCFFWDTIVAMVVSGLFSKELIRRCKHSRFFRHHPKFLLILVRLYLRVSLFSLVAIIDFLLRKLIGIPRVKRKQKSRYKLLFNKNPRFFLALAKLYLRLGRLWKDKSDFFADCNLIVNVFKNFTTETKNQSFKDEIRIDLLVFPKESINTVSKSLHLKIEQRESVPSLLPLKLLIELRRMRFSMFASSKIRLRSWEIDFEIDDIETEIELVLSFPHLFFTLKGKRREASASGLRYIREKGLYVLHFYLYDEFEKIYILKNCIIIHIDDILNLSKIKDDCKTLVLNYNKC